MKLIQWSKHEIFKIILTVNNENISNVNFVEFITPITRISMAFYVLFSNIISSLMPTVVFLMVIFAYFLYKNVRLGSFFLLGNICIFLYIAFFWNNMKEYKQKHEAKINDNDVNKTFAKEFVTRSQLLREISGGTQPCLLSDDGEKFNVHIGHSVTLNVPASKNSLNAFKESI